MACGAYEEFLAAEQYRGGGFHYSVILESDL